MKKPLYSECIFLMWGAQNLLENTTASKTLHLQTFAFNPFCTRRAAQNLFDWCCCYYFVRNSLVALLEALFACCVVWDRRWLVCSRLGHEPGEDSILRGVLFRCLLIKRVDLWGIKYKSPPHAVEVGELYEFASWKVSSALPWIYKSSHIYTYMHFNITGMHIKDWKRVYFYAST